MAEQGGADRTEQATPKRREEARKHGQVILSPEVAPVAVLLAALVVTTAGAPMLLAQTRVVLRAWLAAVGPIAADDGPTWPLMVIALHELGSVLGPFFIVVAVVGIGTVVAQVGFKLTPELAAPQLSRIGLVQGWQRLFSLQGAASLVKAVVKIVVVSLIAFQVIQSWGHVAVAAPTMSIGEILALAGGSVRHLLLVMAIPLAILGAGDWLWQRWRHEQSLKMSRQEVKDEHKESEGDPQVRARFRRAHRELAKRRMLADVRKADVVLTNPVHVAVAIRYRPDEMRAPLVLAKGAEEMAQRIKDAARSAGVPIVERRALARALFRAVQVGSEIPPALYKAVAEILAYIYSLRGVPRGAER